jgi:phage/plasmid-like protein (TIGR03299 family)
MLKEAQLDWRVTKAGTYYDTPDGRKETGKFALYRESDGQFLSNVSDTWTPCQNDEAFSIFEEFVSGEKLEMHTAGSLKNGQIVWGLAKMKESFSLFKEDLTEQYLLLVNPHEHGKSIHVRSTPIRVVCNNTLSFALGEASNEKASQNHRNTFNVELMKSAIGIAKQKLEIYQQQAELISSKKFTEKKVIKYFNDVFPNTSVLKDKKEEPSRNARKAFEILHTQPGHQYGEGTWWQAYNAVTFMADHVIGRNDDTRLHSAWFGPNKERKLYALNQAVKLAA